MKKDFGCMLTNVALMSVGLGLAAYNGYTQRQIVGSREVAWVAPSPIRSTLV